MKKDEILATLPTLNKTDLNAIKLAADALLSHGTINVPVTGTGNHEALLRHCINDYDGSIGGWSGRTATAFKKGAPGALTFLQQHFSRAMGSRVTALALMNYSVRLIVADLRHINAPVIKLTICQSLQKLPKLFNDAFPGYLEGAIGFVELKILGE
ncbi:MAG TPA: hypothetical protein VFR24_27720 [Candidatus Angelobacter sp.]|nr:hypothetical protein [Candidatus Angelobacter sp.]